MSDDGNAIGPLEEDPPHGLTLEAVLNGRKDIEEGRSVSLEDLKAELLEPVRAAETLAEDIGYKERLALYDRIYKSETLTHPKKGRLAPYGAQTDRDAPFVEYLQRVLPIEIGRPAPRILDASCGRGHLAVTLKDLGYHVEATEVSPWLVKELTARGSLAKVSLMTYADMWKVPSGVYDAVISNDVLEHLPEKESIQALRELARVARRYLLVSVGLGRGAVKYPEALGLKLDLHLFTPGHARWERELQRVGRIDHLERTVKTLWGFVEVKPA